MALELAMARFLRLGVALSAGVMGTGLLMRLYPFSPEALASVQAEITQLRTGALRTATPSSTSPFLESTSGWAQDFLQGDPNAWMSAGLLLLVAVPMGRVGFSILLFFRQRDWIYTGISLLVLGLLVFSLAHAGTTPP